MNSTDTIDLTIVREQLSEYFFHLAQRVERCTRILEPSQLWINPFPFGNSLGNLVVHLTGNLNHFIGAEIAQTGYKRDRLSEFSTAVASRSADEILQEFHAAIQMVTQTLLSRDGADFASSVPSAAPPVRNQFGLFLVCAAHISNHIGQMIYLLQAHGFQLDERTW